MVEVGLGTVIGVETVIMALGIGIQVTIKIWEKLMEETHGKQPQPP